MVGTDGNLLDGQSFVVEEQALQACVATKSLIRGWVLHFPLQIGLSVMGNDINFDMSQGWILHSRE